MKKPLVLIVVVLAIVLVIVGIYFSSKGKETKNVELPEFSNNILISFDYGGTGYGTYEETVSAYVTIHKDRTITVKIEDDPLKSNTISSENYEKLISVLDVKELYVLEPEIKDVTDVKGEYLYIYGIDDTVVKRVGGPMPQNNEFIAMNQAIINNIPREWIEGLLDAHIERYLQEKK